MVEAYVIMSRSINYEDGFNLVKQIAVLNNLFSTSMRCKVILRRIEQIML